MWYELLTLIIAPVFAGLVIELFAHWLDERDDD